MSQNYKLQLPRLARFWRWVLLAASVSACFAQAPITDGLVNYWPGHGDAHDTAGHDDGRVSGDVRYVQGQSGQAFQFNGRDAAMDFGTNAGNFGPHDFTVACWMKTSSVNQQEAFLTKRITCDGATVHWQVALGSADPAMTGHIHAGVNNGGFQGYQGLLSSRALNDGVWHHIAWERQTTSSGTTDYILYVDGKLDDIAKSYVSGTPGNAANLAAVADLNNAASLVLGQNVCECCDGTRPYSGAADELQIFNRALASEEIAVIYKATKSQK